MDNNDVDMTVVNTGVNVSGTTVPPNGLTGHNTDVPVIIGTIVN